MQHYSGRSSFAEKVLFSKKKKERKKKRDLTSTSHSFSHCKRCSLHFFSAAAAREAREAALRAASRFSALLAAASRFCCSIHGNCSASRTKSQILQPCDPGLMGRRGAVRARAAEARVHGALRGRCVLALCSVCVRRRTRVSNGLCARRCTRASNGLCVRHRTRVSISLCARRLTHARNGLRARCRALVSKGLCARCVSRLFSRTMSCDMNCQVTYDVPSTPRRLFDELLFLFFSTWFMNR